VVFSGDIVIKYRADKQALYEKVIEIIKEGVEYLSKYDYLGGNGTRGYGRVNIVLRKKEGV
jgi:CRISPR/Cas system CSM-associated protein Csm3 (group 7 of RAMP superfamily)